MFEIKKNIPMPVTVRGKYPWESMEVGDMFFVPLDDGVEADQGSVNAHRKKISGAAAMAGKKLGKSFSTQVCQEDGVWGTGVWRTA